ncbi:MAG: hypothetical protein OXI75_12100 [Rhodospirillales bacterium]|nr:hypothetical protein [Rhodospirillales bacterium]
MSDDKPKPAPEPGHPERPKPADWPDPVKPHVPGRDAPTKTVPYTVRGGGIHVTHSYVPTIRHEGEDDG